MLLTDLEKGSHIYLNLTATRECVTVSQITDNSIEVTNGKDYIPITSPDMFHMLEGIRLTRNILDKNGFHRENLSVYGQPFENIFVKPQKDSQDIYLREDNDNFLLILPSSGNDLDCSFISLPFVHIAQKYFSINYNSIL